MQEDSGVLRLSDEFGNAFPLLSLFISRVIVR